MKALEEKILKEGKVLPGGVLKIDSFLNHQIDTRFLEEIGAEFARLFPEKVTKILTVEASGISMAVATAKHYDYCPVIFAKKGEAANMSDETYSSKLFSFTRKRDFMANVAKDYLQEGDKVLIIDDFLASGQALKALIDICHQAKAEVVGCGIAVEKVHQSGGELIRGMGVRVEFLARIVRMDDDGIEFAE